MGIILRIGQLVVWDQATESTDRDLIGEYDTRTVVRIYNPNSPAASHYNEPSERRQNTLTWSACGFTDFVLRNKLQDILFNEKQDILKGFINLTYHHLVRLQEVRYQLETHPEAERHPDSHDYYDKSADNRVQDDLHSLLWMEWWVEYALSTCTEPTWSIT